MRQVGRESKREEEREVAMRGLRALCDLVCFSSGLEAQGR